MLPVPSSSTSPSRSWTNLVLVHPETLQDVPEWFHGEALLAVAARVGTTRLIDNLPVRVGPGGGALDVFSPARTRTVAEPLRVPRGGCRAPPPGWSLTADVVVVGRASPA